jgi:hypothetical protein
MKILAKSLLILALALCAGFHTAAASTACYEHCVTVGPSCKRCQDAGEFTGVGCTNIGTCGCKHYFPVCAFPLTAVDESLAALGISPAESEPAQCSDSEEPAQPEAAPATAAEAVN